MKLGLSSLLFVQTSIEDAIHKCAELGAGYVEVIYDVPHFSPGYDQHQLTSLRGIIDSYGLGVSVHSSFWDLNPASHHRELYGLTLKQVKQSIDACRTLGGRIVVVHFGRCPIPEAKEFFEEAKKRYREFIEQSLSYAQERGITLALENAGGQSNIYPSTAEELGQFVVGLEGAKITFDIGHAHLAERRAGKKNTGEAIAGSIKALREHIVHIHVHDNHGKWDEHLPPGDGDIDFKSIVSALRSVGYDGLLIAEPWDPEHPLETGRKTMERIRSIFSG